jgi:hypothetical protein
MGPPAQSPSQAALLLLPPDEDEGLHHRLDVLLMDSGLSLETLLPFSYSVEFTRIVSAPFPLLFSKDSEVAVSQGRSEELQVEAWL